MQQSCGASGIRIRIYGTEKARKRTSLDRQSNAITLFIGGKKYTFLYPNRDKNTKLEIARHIYGYYSTLVSQTRNVLMRNGVVTINSVVKNWGGGDITVRISPRTYGRTGTRGISLF